MADIPKMNGVNSMTSREFCSDVDAHLETMGERMKDAPTVQIFQAAILHNKHLFRGRTILDVGCGVGILSLFAAKAGAARVYAVDPSNVVDYTREVVAANGYSDVIIVLKGRMQDVELPEQVDIIVSDWMGYSLFFQSICDAVIYAREKWLRKGGLIFPDQAKLFICALEEPRHKKGRFDWWNDVYGFNLSAMRKCALHEPSYQHVPESKILSTYYCVKTLNMHKATTNDLQLKQKFKLEMCRSGKMDGIVAYFHVIFTNSHTPKYFSTDPSSPRTQWMQTVFYFEDPVNVVSGELLYGGIEMLPAFKGDSAGEQCDLNDFIVNFELYRGNLPHINLAVDISWHMKPHTHPAAVYDDDISKHFHI